MRYLIAGLTGIALGVCGTILYQSLHRLWTLGKGTKKKGKR